MTRPNLVVAEYEYATASNTHNDGFSSTTIPTAIAIASPVTTDATTISMTATNDRLSTQQQQQASCRVLEVIGNDTNYGTATIISATVTNSNGTWQLQQAVPTTDNNNSNGDGNDDASVSSQSSAGTIVHPPDPLPKHFCLVINFLMIIAVCMIAGISAVVKNSTSKDNNRNDDGFVYVPIDMDNPVSVACNFLRYTNISKCQRTSYYVNSYYTLMGSIPTEIGLLTQLQRFELSNQRNVTGTIPTTLFLLRNLTTLVLENNDPQLFGMTIPSDIGNLVKLTTLSLEGNQLMGTLPSSMGNLVHLTGLTLGMNLLSGTIPLSFRYLTNIRFLYLDKNQFTGPIPITTIFSSFVNISFLRIHNNPQFVGGTISSSQCTLLEERYTKYYIDCEPPQIECSCCYSGDTDRLCPS